MEKNMAILMADLSGYTALTETHGAYTAADLIEKYIHIAEKSLTGNTRLHERTGDELMFVAESPEDLLATLLKLEANTMNEENFLQIHGGLHYGKLLNRGGDYFGSTINLVSRIAGSAGSGTFWCSDDFINSLSDKTVSEFIPMGRRHFKNISGEKDVFELNIVREKVNYIDPICRMLIMDHHKAIHHPHQHEIYFCSSTCLHLYGENIAIVSSF